MGKHILASLYGVSFALLDDMERIQRAFDEAVEAMGATVLNRFVHKFEPQGVTIVYALAESHISIHSFPENGSCAIDVYTCGNMDSMKGMEVLCKLFKPVESRIEEVSR